MSQAGFTPIQSYYSTTPGGVPTTANLAAGELAVNIADGKLFYKNSAGTAVRAIEQDSQSTYLTSVAGTNTITASLAPALTAYKAGQVFRFVAAATNTGAVTLNVNGLGAKAVTKSGSSPLEVGDIAAGAAIQVTYDGTQFQLVSGAGGGGAKAGGVFYENSTTLTSNYTLTTGKNAMMAGPLTVNSGVVLTIPSGQRLVIL